jgi:phosphate-selective porin OprO/OprP
MHFGLSATWRKTEPGALGNGQGNGLGGPGMVQFRARPELRDAIGDFGSGGAPGNSTRMVDTGAFIAPSTTVLGGEWLYFLGPLSFQAEYALVSANDAVVTVGTGRAARTTRGDRTFSGGYGQVSYFLTGETRLYDKQYGRLGTFYVDPFTNFWLTEDEDTGRLNFGSGAVELAARYSYLNLNDGPVQGGVLGGLTVGLNWYLSSNLKLQFEWVHNARWDRGIPGQSQTNANTPPGAVGTTVDGFGARMQMQF